MSKKNLTVEDLNLSPEEMEILVTGARVLFPEADPQEGETSPLTGLEKSES